MCAVYIDAGYGSVAGLVVAGTGFVVTAAFASVIRYGFRVDDSNHVGGRP